MIKIERWFAPDMIQRYEKKDAKKKIKEKFTVQNGLAKFQLKILF